MGTVFSVIQAEAGWFGEGDDLFFVDGETKASIEGTGSEDYFNDAWGLHVNEGLYNGVTVAQGTGLGSRMTAYRWHLVDPVPFKSPSKLEIEHRGWTFEPDGAVKSAFGERTDLISSVAFWYQKGIATDQPEVPYGRARLPKETRYRSKSNKRSTRSERRTARFPWRGALLVQGRVVLRRRRTGCANRSSLRRSRGWIYELYTQVRTDRTTASSRCCSTASRLYSRSRARARRGHPSEDRFEGYAPETYVGPDYQVGWPNLPKGRHTLTYICLGKESGIERLSSRRRQHRPRTHRIRRLVSCVADARP